MILLAPHVKAGDFVVGEKPAPLQYQFQDANGDPLPLVGYTVKFVIREMDGTATTYNATLVDGPTGTVGYTWTGVEFPGPGHYESEFWAGNSVQRFCSILITYTVRNSVGPVPSI